MVQRLTSKLASHEGVVLHTLLESILSRLDALENPGMSLMEDAEEKPKVEETTSLPPSAS